MEEKSGYGTKSADVSQYDNDPMCSLSYCLSEVTHAAPLVHITGFLGRFDKAGVLSTLQVMLNFCR